MKLVSSTGALITGTLERLTASAAIDIDKCSTAPDGTLLIEYSGSSDVHWDEQRTVVRKLNGKELRVFLDEDGNEVLESDVKLVSEDEAEPA